VTTVIHIFFTSDARRKKSLEFSDIAEGTDCGASADKTMG